MEGEGVKGDIMNHQGTKTLETERLVLRRFTMADAEALFGFLRDIKRRLGSITKRIKDF